MLGMSLLYNSTLKKSWYGSLVWLLALANSLQTWRQPSEGAVNQAATQRTMSPQRDSCANLIFECQWLESRSSQRSSQMRLFCKIYPNCHSWWLEVRWVSDCQPWETQFLLWGKEQRKAREELCKTSPVFAIFGAPNLSKRKNRKSIRYILFRRELRSTRIKPKVCARCGVPEQNKHTQHWCSLGVRHLLKNKKVTVFTPPHKLLLNVSAETLH